MRRLYLLVDQLFETRIGAFLGMDVIVSTLALWVFVFSEGKRLAKKNLWVYIVCNLTVGVSLALPLFLYQREKALGLRQRRFERLSILQERDAMMASYFGYLDSPVGLVEIEGTREAITGLHFVDERRPGATANAVLEEAQNQVLAYFRGDRRRFDLPLDLGGTGFQRAVWQHVLKIPFGETASYGEVALAIGRPRAVRAVGAANGRNPISIVVPCHRVLGSDGSLTGYGGGLWRKEWLLRHEGRFR